MCKSFKAIQRSSPRMGLAACRRFHCGSRRRPGRCLCSPRCKPAASGAATTPAPLGYLPVRGRATRKIPSPPRPRRSPLLRLRLRRRSDRPVEQIERRIDRKRRPAEAAVALGFEIRLHPALDPNLATRMRQQFGHALSGQRPCLDDAGIRKIEPIRLPGFRKGQSCGLPSP